MAVTSTVNIPPPSGLAVAWTDATYFDDGTTWLDRTAQGTAIDSFMEAQKPPIDEII